MEVYTTGDATASSALFMYPSGAPRLIAPTATPAGTQHAISAQIGFSRLTTANSAAGIKSRKNGNITRLSKMISSQLPCDRNRKARNKTDNTLKMGHLCSRRGSVALLISGSSSVELADCITDSWATMASRIGNFCLGLSFRKVRNDEITHRRCLAGTASQAYVRWIWAPHSVPSQSKR